MPPTPHIRLATPADAGACVEIYRPSIERSHASFEVTVPGVEDFAARMRDTLDDYPWLVSTDEDGAVTGYAYAFRHRSRHAYQWNAEVSAYVDSAAHRRGVGRALYLALFDCLRTQGMVNAYAGVTLPNDPSVAFHESLGFEPVGVYRRIGFKFGEWHDVGWWALRLREDDNPTPPRWLRSCRDEIVALLARRR